MTPKIKHINELQPSEASYWRGMANEEVEDRTFCPKCMKLLTGFHMQSALGTTGKYRQ
jgi:hypothetical protein